MSVIRSYFLFPAEMVAKAPKCSPDILAFASVTDVKTFELMHGRIGKEFFGMLAGSSHYANASHMLKQGYESKAQYVKFIGERMQQPFVKKGKCFAFLADGSFGVDMNRMRSCVKKMYGKESEQETVPMMVFDSGYTGTGVLYDIARVSGESIEDLEASPKYAMGINDAQLYLARWGGIPGKEKWAIPYGMKP